MLPVLWSKWVPSPLITGMYQFAKIQGDVWNIEIELTSINSPFLRVQFFFECPMIAYQQTLLSWRKKTLEILHQQLGVSSRNWTFFTAQHSSYVAWLSQQSCETSMPDTCTHYVFITPDSMLDFVDWGKQKNQIIVTHNEYKEA